eukprot:5510548-Lingulodinium_polyedra.AAC.1
MPHCVEAQSLGAQPVPAGRRQDDTGIARHGQCQVTMELLAVVGLGAASGWQPGRRCDGTVHSARRDFDAAAGGRL